MTDRIRQQVAAVLGTAIRSAYPDHFEAIGQGLKVADSTLEPAIYAKLESPKDPAMGDYAFPAFLLAGVLQEKPADIAAKIYKAITDSGFAQVGPYINYNMPAPLLAEMVLPQIRTQGADFGSKASGMGKTIVIDYSSPNIAKPFGVGHLRSTAIGHSLCRMYQKLGYTVIGVNHLGDWGTQFGKVILAYRLWGNESELHKDPINQLYELYVRFHKEEEANPALSEEARGWFKKLEDGDPEAVRLWKLFRDYSLEEFKRIYDILGISFDYYTGESFYNDLMEPVIERLRNAGLAIESRGALIVDLKKYGMAPCLLRKADGATLYATRELAGTFYRHEHYQFDKAIYVVGAGQQEHFKQVFKVLELLGEPYADRLEHVEFGWIRFQDKAMSTRAGNIVVLEEVINTAIAKARQIIKDKNPELPRLEETAKMIGVGAILFSDLGVKRHKDINFSWEEALNFEGGSGPYLQYTHARLSALLRKYGKVIDGTINYAVFDSPEEKGLLRQLYEFERIVELAAERNEPNFIAEYLLDLAAIFNRFYQRKDDAGRLVKIISDNPEETAARIQLVAAVRIVLCEGLRLFGIEAPEEM